MVGVSLHGVEMTHHRLRFTAQGFQSGNDDPLLRQRRKWNADLRELVDAQCAISSSSSWRSSTKLFKPFLRRREVMAKKPCIGSFWIDTARDESMRTKSPAVPRQSDCHRTFPCKDIRQNQVARLDAEKPFGAQLGSGDWWLVKGTLAERTNAKLRVLLVKLYFDRPPHNRGYIAKGDSRPLPHSLPPT